MIKHEGADIIPNSLVQSCSDCSREKMEDGLPNIIGATHRAMYTKKFGKPGTPGYIEILDCASCPVTKHAYATGEMWEVLRAYDGED